MQVDAAYPRGEEFRTSAEYVTFCRRASEALADAMAAGRRTMPAPVGTAAQDREQRDRTLRIARADLRAGARRRGWELVVRINGHPAYMLPAPSHVSDDAW